MHTPSSPTVPHKAWAAHPLHADRITCLILTLFRHAPKNGVKTLRAMIAHDCHALMHSNSVAIPVWP